MHDSTMPVGFRESGHAGLLVPVSTERRREVWDATERKVMDRAAKVALLHGIRLALTCVREGCGGALERTDDDFGQPVLRCACSDRILTRLQ